VYLAVAKRQRFYAGSGVYRISMLCGAERGFESRRSRDLTAEVRA
jgi:hypothetical protein